MKEKRKSLTNISIIALILALITLIAVSGTYAKYTTTYNGTAKAVVAKWDFKAKNGAEPLSATENFTIKLADTATKGKVTVGDVNKIQPGSEGDIVITIDNTASEVAASLNVKAETISNATLDSTQFTFEAPVLKQDGSDTVVTSIEAGKTGTATVHWKWIYSSSDEYDTKDTQVGNGAGAEIDLIKLVVTGYQAEPGV